MEYAGMEPTSSKSSWEDPLLYNIVEEDQTSNPHRDNSAPSRHTDTKHKSRDQEASPNAVSMLIKKKKKTFQHADFKQILILIF